MLNQVLTAEIGDESHRSATEPDYSAISKKPASADFFAGSGLATEGLKDFFDSVWANDICAKKQAVLPQTTGLKSLLLTQSKTSRVTSFPDTPCLGQASLAKTFPLLEIWVE